MGFLLVRIAQLYFYVPMPELGGDAVFKWELAKALYFSEPIEKLLEGQTVSHHFMRWMSWVPALLAVTFFGDNATGYYMATFIPTCFAASLFLYIIFYYANNYACLLVALLWLIDHQFERAAFQLLPSGSGMLPLAMICLISHLYNLNRIGINFFIFSCALFLFLAYGAKESNLFFVPGIMAYIYLQKEKARAFLGLFLGSVFYVLETICFRLLIGPKFSNFGRIAELFGEGGHINEINKTAMPNIFDAGLFTRWLILPPSQLMINLSFFGLLIYFFCNFKTIKKNISPHIINYLSFIAFSSISFIFLTTFFIVDLSPLTLGQPLRPRYLVILLPLAYLFIFISVCNFKFSFSSRKKLFVIYAVLALIAQASYKPDLYRASLSEFNAYFIQKAVNLPTTICVPVEDSRKWLFPNIWYLPNSFRNENFKQIEKSELLNTDKYWVMGDPIDCDLKTFDIRLKDGMFQTK